METPRVGVGEQLVGIASMVPASRCDSVTSEWRAESAGDKSLLARPGGDSWLSMPGIASVSAAIHVRGRPEELAIYSRGALTSGVTSG